ncbi:hypothetical protein [Helicobacter sp. T3_23-1056]
MSLREVALFNGDFVAIPPSLREMRQHFVAIYVLIRGLLRQIYDSPRNDEMFLDSRLTPFSLSLKSTH